MRVCVVRRVGGARECVCVCRKCGSCGARLTEVFSEPFVRSTYMDQRRHWIKASEEQREVGIAAHHTAAGLWSAFA
jgi:hypothetical protein